VITCKCGCGAEIRPGRVFLSREHQLNWQSEAAAQNNAAASRKARDEKASQTISGLFDAIGGVTTLAVAVALVLGLIYALVRFVKWAWQ
jgi:hypothetical protein